MKMCKRYKALQNFGRDREGGTSFFHKDDILIEVAPGEGYIRPEKCEPGLTGIHPDIFEEELPEYLEEMESIPFKETKNFIVLKDQMVAELAGIKESIAALRSREKELESQLDVDEDEEVKEVKKRGRVCICGNLCGAGAEAHRDE